MKLYSKVLVIAVLATVCFAMISCAGPANPGSSYQNVTISLSYYPICNGCGTTGTGGFTYGIDPPGAGGISGPQICSPASSTCLVSGTVSCSPVTLTCQTGGAIQMPPGGGSGSCAEVLTQVTNAPFNPTYTIIPSPVSTSPVTSSYSPNVGTINNINGNTAFYCEPGSIPVYSGAQLAQAQAAGLPMGITELVVTNPASATDPTKVVSASLYFAFQSISLPANQVTGVIPGGNVTVPLGTTYQFTGYAAGNNGYVTPVGTTAPTGGCVTPNPTSCIPAYQVFYNVNGTIGGSTTYGTISSTGLYTAPTVYPVVSGATVKTATITATSAAYPNSTITTTSATVNFP